MRMENITPKYFQKNVNIYTKENIKTKNYIDNELKSDSYSNDSDSDSDSNNNNNNNNNSNNNNNDNDNNNDMGKIIQEWTE